MAPPEATFTSGGGHVRVQGPQQKKHTYVYKFHFPLIPGTSLIEANKKNPNPEAWASHLSVKSAAGGTEETFENKNRANGFAWQMRDRIEMLCLRMPRWRPASERTPDLTHDTPFELPSSHLEVITPSLCGCHVTQKKKRLKTGPS